MMEDHKIILNMIEEVEPSDTTKLDDIDRELCMWLMPESKRRQIERGLTGLYHIPKYTQSRDALKAIRPEGWSLEHINKETDNEIVAWFYNSKLEKGIGNNICKTEELAELHAIIQAIAYEREIK